MTSIQKVKGLDWLGTVLTAGLFVSLTMAVTFGGTIWPWKDGRLIALIVVFVVLSPDHQLWRDPISFRLDKYVRSVIPVRVRPRPATGTTLRMYGLRKRCSLRLDLLYPFLFPLRARR